MDLHRHSAHTTAAGPVRTSALTTTFALGAPVHCEDGPCGELSRVVVDATSHRVTHLVVVAPERGHAVTRRVPAGLARGDEHGVALACERAALTDLPHAEEHEPVAIAAGDRMTVAGGVVGRVRLVVAAPGDHRVIGIVLRRRPLRRLPEITVPVGVHDLLEHRGAAVHLMPR